MKKRNILIVLIVFMFISMSAASAANTTYNTSSISNSAGKVQRYVENHQVIATKIPIDGNTITSSEFLYLLTKDVQNINQNTDTSITSMDVLDPTGPTETITTNGTLTLSEYTNAARKISVFIEKYGRAPNYVSTSLGYMQYENMIYTFSKVMNFYRTYDRLPNTVSVATWSSITGTSTVVTSGGTVNFTDTSDTTTTQIGSDSNGYVLKIGPFGNASSTNKIAVIIGVHFQEGAAHLAMLNALKTLSSQLNNVQIWVYKVVITNDLDDYSLSREHGQDLASAFVVPDIDSSYKLVVDTHGNRGLYATNDFVFAPYEDSNSVNYANEIVGTTDYLKYFYVSGSSPDYVTIPIAKKGIASVVFELYLNVDKYNIVLYNKCLQVVEGLNTIFA